MRVTLPEAHDAGRVTKPILKNIRPAQQAQRKDPCEQSSAGIRMLEQGFHDLLYSGPRTICQRGIYYTFIILSVIFNSIFLVISVFSYDFGGLTGLGIGFLIYYFFHFVSLKVLTKYLYGINFTNSFYRTFIICALFCLSSYVITLVESLYLRYSLLLILAGISIGFSLVQFQQKMDLMQLLRSLLKKSPKD